MQPIDRAYMTKKEYVYTDDGINVFVLIRSVKFLLVVNNEKCFYLIIICNGLLKRFFFLLFFFLS